MPLSTTCLDHFGLSRNPFALQPDPGFLYWSLGARGARDVLQRGLARPSRVMLLTGEIGVGKTILLRHLAEHLALDPRKRVVWCDARTDHGVLQAELAAGLLLIDGADALSADALDTLQALSERPVVGPQIVLSGRPELTDALRALSRAGLVGRVGAQYHMPILVPREVGPFIAHRLLRAGGRADLITRDAVQHISAATGNVPGEITALCAYALREACQAGERQVTGARMAQILGVSAGR